MIRAALVDKPRPSRRCIREADTASLVFHQKLEHIFQHGIRFGDELTALQAQDPRVPHVLTGAEGGSSSSACSIARQ